MHTEQKLQPVQSDQRAQEDAAQAASKPDAFTLQRQFGQPLVSDSSKGGDDKAREFYSPTMDKTSPRQPAQEDTTEVKGVLGGQRALHQGDLCRYGPDLLEFLSLKDAHKRAVTGLIASTVKYEEACSNLAKMEDSMMSIFKEIKSGMSLTDS